MQYKIADFGIVPYGRSVFGVLKQATPYDLCQIDKDKQKKEAN